MLVNIRPSFPNNSALAEGTRVKLTTGYLVAADGSTDELGTLEQRVLATDTVATVTPLGQACVRHMIAIGAITQYATVYAAASGKIDATGTLVRGIAMEAASGDGSVIKVLTNQSTNVGTQTLSVAAAAVTVGGTAIGNANNVAYGFTRVTGANNSAAVKLPAAAAGMIVILKSLTSGSTLQVFPAVGDKINGAAANAVYNMANLSKREFVAYDDTDWYTSPETPT